MDFLTLPLSGWASPIFTLFMLVVGGWFILTNARSKAKVMAEEAQKSAIGAMQAEIEALRRRMDDEQKENARRIQSVQKENVRLEHIIDTICTALKSQGIIISINGEIINISIEDQRKITTVRIQEIEEKP